MFGWATYYAFGAIVTACGHAGSAEITKISSRNGRSHHHSAVNKSGGLSVAPGHGGTECRVPASMAGISDALNKAAVKCSNNARIIVEAGESLIDQVVVMRDLVNVEVSILGHLHLKPDWNYWHTSGFAGIKEDTNTTVVWSYVGGKNLHINGGGTFNGNGLSAWKAYYKDKDTPRPALVLLSNITGGSYSNLRHIDSPSWNLYLDQSQHIRVFNYQVEIHDGGAGSDTEAKNTDAFNTRDSSFLEVYHSRFYNTDDAIAIKAGSSNIYVHDIIGAYRCGGLSVGSLGNVATAFETATNITFDHIELRNCRAGARVKAWAGRPAAIKELTGGGGGGLMKDITYSNINLKDVESGINVETCYGVKQTNEDCFGAPSKVTIENLAFTNIVGTVKPKAPWSDANVGNILCSAGKKTCNGIRLTNVILEDTYNHTLNPLHCGGITQADFHAPGLLCDYPKYTKRRWNGTVQMQIGPKAEIYGPLITSPTLPVGYTSPIPAPDGLWKPKFPAAPKMLPYVTVSQPEWPEEWEAAVKDLVSPPPTGDAVPKRPDYSPGGDDVDGPP